jgi:hypothetical protein
VVAVPDLNEREHGVTYSFVSSAGQSIPVTATNDGDGSVQCNLDNGATMSFTRTGTPILYCIDQWVTANGSPVSAGDIYADPSQSSPHLQLPASQLTVRSAFVDPTDNAAAFTTDDGGVWVQPAPGATPSRIASTYDPAGAGNSSVVNVVLYFGALQL